ncbi:hypothetical protein D3C86_1803470 [compost metagenome]
MVTRASEMPPAISLGSPVPNRVMAWKVAIIPTTVPSRPSSGATEAISLMRLMPFSNLGTLRRMISSSLDSRSSMLSPRWD